jgi:protein SCO1/2
VLLGAVSLGAAFVIGRSDTRRVTPQPDAYRGSEPPAGLRLPRFSLREASGARVESTDVRGRVVVVTFLETKCREACPVIADQIGAGLDLLGAGERRLVYAVAIGTHPGDDSPRNVRIFLRRHRVENDLHYLIGSERQLRPVWSAFKVLPALDSGDADTHSAPVRIFDREGRWVSTLHPGVDLTPANLVHDIRTAVDASS